MAQVKDSRVILAGKVLDIEDDFEFEGGQKQLRARKFTVNSGDGMSIVKIKLDAPIQVPQLGDSVVWWIRPRAWSMDGGRSGMSVAFLGKVSVDELGEISELVG